LPEVPPDITFITLPIALAQFHHLPIHVPVWVKRQEEIQQKGYDFQEGFQVMQELLEKSSGIPGAYLYQLFVRKWPRLREINSYFQSGRIAEAIPKLVEILDIDPECPLTSFQLGYCFRATGELEKSESFYLKAIRMAPEAGWIYSNLGRTYQAMGPSANAKASEAFWKALELLPGDTFVLEQLMGLGEIFLVAQPGTKGAPAFMRRGEYEKKMEETLLKEKSSVKLVQSGWKLLQDRLFDLARRYFEKARESEKIPETLLGLGLIHLEEGRYPEAEHFLMEYLDENPDSIPAHLSLYKVYLAQEEGELAWDEIQTAVRLDPNGLDSLRQLFSHFQETDRMEEGLEWLDQFSLENPLSFAALLVKAQALTRKGKWEDAKGAAMEALRRAPHEEEVLLFYTSELGKRGLEEELVGLLEKETEPLPLSLTINLALAFSRLGKMDRGKGILQEFVAREKISPWEKAKAETLLREFQRESI
jgi:tetratricopeptide (TPR) repeat protein